MSGSWEMDAIRAHPLAAMILFALAVILLFAVISTLIHRIRMRARAPGRRGASARKGR